VYVGDDPYEKADAVQRYLKSHDRIIFVDFGVGVDEASLDQCFEKHEGVGCLVFPGVKEGIDWEMFKTKVKDGMNEPTNQMGLHFDTKVDKKVGKDIYNVSETEARAWMMNTKNVMKVMQKTKDLKVSPKMFEKFSRQGVRICAFTAAKLTMTYTHECVSNILNAAGVKIN
jgi:microsomal dipeptidase-like Zn-dependent dipeptidase